MTATSPPRRIVLDRIEGSVAVLLDDEGEAVEVPRAWLPATASEGDAITLAATPSTDDGTADRLARLRASDPGGDLDL